MKDLVLDLSSPIVIMQSLNLDPKPSNMPPDLQAHDKVECQKASHCRNLDRSLVWAPLSSLSFSMQNILLGLPT